MKLLICPKGFIGTRIGPLDIVIDKLPTEERGYTLVDEEVASILLKRGGYEAVPENKYPRDIEQLKYLVKEQLENPGVMTGATTYQGPVTREQDDPSVVKVISRVQKKSETKKRPWWLFWKR